MGQAAFCLLSIHIWKKGRLNDISLSFQADQFLHLSGVHYIKDIDLKRPYNKRKFLSMVLSGQIDAAAIEKSADWADIRGRMEGITRLENILDGDFVLYLFRPETLPFHSDITANYLIKNLQTGESVFLFVDGPLSASFCKSIFTMTDRDYSKGQIKVSLLKKCKYMDGDETILFNKIHRNTFFLLRYKSIRRAMHLLWRYSLIAQRGALEYPTYNLTDSR